MANQFLGLSLFIMLLSFFIILNALSDFDEEKAAPIFNSLSSAFSVKNMELIDISNTRSDRESQAKGTTLDKIQGLFTAQITGLRAKQNRLGTVLRLRLPFATFQKEVQSSLSRTAQNAPSTQNSKAFFLATLVSLVDTQNGTPYKMDMVVFVPEGQKSKDSAQNTAKEIAKIARKIERAGLPKKMLTVGVAPGGDSEKGMVDLYFRPYHPFDTSGYRQGVNDG